MQLPLPLVLVVDDADDTRTMYAEYLATHGFRVDVAKDGEEAIERTRVEVPRVMVLDLSMPRMDGWEAARVFKADPRTRGICIIAVTGHAEAVHYAGARHAGCDYFLAKPCSPAELLAHIEASLLPDCR
jgi:CheY-like chemotaxis protein